MKLRTHYLLGFGGMCALTVLVAVVSNQPGAVTSVAVTRLAVVLGAVLMQYPVRAMLAQVGDEPEAVAAAVDQPSCGDLTAGIGGQAGIAGALAKMAATLRRVTAQANAIAHGETTVPRVPRVRRRTRWASLCGP